MNWFFVLPAIQILFFFGILFAQIGTPEKESKQERVKRIWIENYGQHPNVRRWLERNPPPQDWQESPEAYAYTEMPIWVMSVNDTDGWENLYAHPSLEGKRH